MSSIMLVVRRGVMVTGTLPWLGPEQEVAMLVSSTVLLTAASWTWLSSVLEMEHNNNPASQHGTSDTSSSFSSSSTSWSSELLLYLGRLESSRMRLQAREK